MQLRLYFPWSRKNFLDPISLKQTDLLLMRDLMREYSVCDIATAHVAKHLQRSGPRFSKGVLVVRPIDQHINWVMGPQVHKGLYRSFNSEFDFELVELDSFVLIKRAGMS
jgi:hypothetical protein